MIRFTLGLFSLVLAVGCIDGGYNGIPMNDNWTGFFGFAIFGIAMMIWSLPTVTQK